MGEKSSKTQKKCRRNHSNQSISKWSKNHKTKKFSPIQTIKIDDEYASASCIHQTSFIKFNQTHKKARKIETVKFRHCPDSRNNPTHINQFVSSVWILCSALNSLNSTTFYLLIVLHTVFNFLPFIGVLRSGAFHSPRKTMIKCYSVSSILIESIIFVLILLRTTAIDGDMWL